jgi:hypothetical protein
MRNHSVFKAANENQHRGCVIAHGPEDVEQEMYVLLGDEAAGVKAKMGSGRDIEFPPYRGASVWRPRVKMPRVDAKGHELRKQPIPRVEPAEEFEVRRAG